MQPAVCIHDIAYLARLECEGSICKLLLHVSMGKITQVTPLPGTATVGLGDGQVTQRIAVVSNSLLMPSDNLSRLVFSPRDGCLVVAVASQ